MTSSWFFLSTLNYDARSTTHQNAGYLNTNYKEDQFVNIVKSHESTQQNTNSIIKTAAKIREELSELYEKSDTKHDGIQHTMARLGESLKKKWKINIAWAVH